MAGGIQRMCGRYVLVQKVEVLEKRFGVKAPPGLVFEPNVNIGIGNEAPVITDAAPGVLQLFTFGLTPFWAKKPLYLFNARAEGDRNMENDPHYTGGLDIISKPAFRKAIRNQRCLVPADAFIEGTIQEKLAKPYLVYITDRDPPFAFAGLWDRWVEADTGRTVLGFSIITTTANAVLQRLPHHRSPVVLPPHLERAWLDPNLPLSEVLAMLLPYPAEGMNAYPIDPAIRTPGKADPGLLRPLGPAVRAERELRFGLELMLQGMGGSRRKDRS
jgi:putative SOS response-associated peptidase YedK